MWSYCYSCKKPIPWYDNIPILSYFLLRGKCRQCGAGFSIRYALIEFLTAVLFVITAWRFYPISVIQQSGVPLVRFDITLFFYLPLVAALVIITFTDFDEMIVPDTVTYPLAIYGFVLAAVVQFLFQGNGGYYVQQLWGWDTSTFITSTYRFFSIDPLYGALAGAVPLYLIGVLGKMVFKKDAMGFGDVKLMFAVGTLLGWRLTLIALMIAVFLGAFVGVALILSRRSALGRQIPFGPYLAVASYICLIWGPQLQAAIYWYYIGRFAGPAGLGY